MTPDYDRLPGTAPTGPDFDGVAVEFCVPPALYERESTNERFVLWESPAMLRSLLREIGARAPSASSTSAYTRAEASCC